MELTEEQLNLAITNAIKANNTFLEGRFVNNQSIEKFVLQKQLAEAIEKCKPGLSEEQVKSLIEVALTTLETKINADLKKLIAKVFPDQPAAKRKSDWFAFD